MDRKFLTKHQIQLTMLQISSNRRVEPLMGWLPISIQTRDSRSSVLVQKKERKKKKS